MKTKWLRQIKHIALDLDGTIYKDNSVFPETLKFLECIDNMEIGHSFVTNNSSKSRDDYVTKLSQMGINARPEQIFTSAHATIEYVQQNQPAYRKLYLVGTASLADEFRQSGFEILDRHHDSKPDAVIVGFDPNLKYLDLCKACYWISKKVPYLATHPDRVCPTDENLVLVDCGSICCAIEAATGEKPLAVPGKPSPDMLSGIMTKFGLDCGELAMVGDRLYTDIMMANAADALSVLVLTGEANRQDCQACECPPAIIVDNLSDFGQLLLNANRRN